MQPHIPIIVTNTGHKFISYASPTLIQQLQDKRHPSLPKPRNNNLQLRHQTLDPDKQLTTESRTRRISSSAAAKRFPKDFFKDQNCLHPIKSNRPKHKQYEPCLLDTFSHKIFLVPQNQSKDNKQQSDTPKFKHKQCSQSSKKVANDRLRNKVQQLIQQTPTSKYHTASQIQNKHPLLQIFDPQKQQQQPFGTIPFISNFNVTLGKKVALSFLAQKGQKSKRKKEDQKENNEGIDSARRLSNGKAQGFRIRKKLN